MSTEPAPSTPGAADSTTAAPASGMTCPDCGTANPPGMKFCGNCGARLTAAPPPAPNNGGAGGEGAAASAGSVAVGTPAPPLLGAGGGAASLPLARPTVTVPADPIARERERDRLLTLANVQRMRGQLDLAQGTLGDVLTLLETSPAPESAPVHELRGDLFASQEKWDEALAAYTAAHEADPNRASSERKFAAATLRIADAKAMQAAMASGNMSEIAALNAGQRGRRNPGTALLLSLFVPGLGQFANGQMVKGGMCLAIYLLTLLALNLSPEGNTMFKQFLGFLTGKLVPGSGQPVSPFFWMLVMIAAGVWVFSLVDAAMSASKLNEEVSGGDTTAFGGFSRKDWEP